MAEVLLVEDEPDHAYLLTQGLTLGGHVVQHAGDGLLAWAMLSSGQVSPGVILSDWVLPGLNGLELFSRCATHPVLNDVPFVLLSARAHDHQRQQAAAAGVRHFVAKPFRVAHVAELVHDLSEHH